MRAAVLLLAVASSGCTSLGVGSAYVGQWRAHDEVAFRACREDESGRCLEHKEVVRHVPERSFSGVIVPYAAMGVAWVTHEDRTIARYRIEPSLEILHGRGRAAWGIRSGAMIDVRGAVAVPAMAMVHYSLFERVSVYGSAGFVPFARRARETSLLGGRGLLGFQWAFARTDREAYWVLSVEADTVWLRFAEPYRSTGITGHLGLFF